MISLILALDLIPAACGAQLPTRLPPIARARTYNITVDTLGTSFAVPGAADSLWKVLPGAYAALGLQVHETDARQQRIATCWMRVRRRLNNSPLSKFLECGEVRSVPNADRLEVELLVVTTVRAGADGTSIGVFVLGTAGESAGSSDRTWCTSTGALEARIRDEVARRM